jgi:hypothetical protein
MRIDRQSTLRLLHIRPLSGRNANFFKHSRGTARRFISCAIGMEPAEKRFVKRRTVWVSGNFSLLRNGPGRRAASKRLWGTFQDRLTSELRLARAADLHAANEVLRRFLPDYNRRLVVRRAKRKSWAPRSQRPRAHLLLRARTRDQQRQLRAVGRTPLSDPAPAQRISFAGAKA